MNTLSRMISTTVLAVASLGMAAELVGPGPGNSSHLPSQMAADILREYSSSDAAFLAAGLVKSEYQQDNLASLLIYPDDELVILSLKGSQIRAALERSMSLYPEENPCFLQLSGIEVSATAAAQPNKRINSILVGGSKLDDAKTYRVAMPSSLGRGGMGYLKVWGKTDITKTYANVTVGSILSGKKYLTLTPRWTIATATSGGG